MVAHREHVGAEVEEVLGDLRRQPKAAGRILRVHNGELDTVRLAHVPDVLAHDPAPRTAKNVADEKNVQVELLASSLWFLAQTAGMSDDREIRRVSNSFARSPTKACHPERRP